MPSMDFSDVIASQEFADVFTVVSTTSVVSDQGVATNTPGSPVSASGVVVPGKSSLRRLDDGTRVAAYIDIYTTYPLVGGIKTNDTNSQIADVVTWHGRQFTVVAVEDYSAFGAGFIHASCDLLALNPTA